jgi:hypothetical protein
MSLQFPHNPNSGDAAPAALLFELPTEAGFAE